MRLHLTTGHPRIYLTPGELPAFRRKSLGFRRPWRELLLRQLEAHLDAPLKIRAQGRNGPEFLALALGEAWRLTGDPRYGRAGHWLLESLESYGEGGGGYDLWGNLAEAAALLYDWLHDYWRAQGLEREAAAAVLFCSRRALADLQHQYIVDDWHNYSLGLQAGILAGALAIGNDHPGLESGELLQTMQRLHFTGLPHSGFWLQDLYQVPPIVRCLDAALKADGGAGFACHWESVGAYHSVDSFELAKMARYWDSGLRRSSRDRLVWPELLRAGEALLQLARPDGCHLPWGDSTPHASKTRVANILFLLHARTPQPAFAEFLSQFGRQADQPYPIHALHSATPDCTPTRRMPKAFVYRAWPLSARFDPYVIMRSGWDVDATAISFRCGRHGGYHNHLDHNSFTIFRGGALALDPGNLSYMGTNRTEYSMRTLAHNAILVRNPREKSWFGRFRQPTVNDGGQRLVTLSHVPPNPVTGGPHALLTEERRRRLANEFDMGNTLAWLPGEVADYVAGDATRAYTYPWSGVGDNPSRRVEEAVRQIVFLKPDLVIVFDRVEATKAGYEKTWLLHTAGAPFYCRGGRWKSAPRGIQRLPAEGPFEFTQERGRLTVWPLLPEQRKVRAIGGPGYEFWVEGAPSAPAGKNEVPHGYPNKNSKELGGWRLEISPTAPVRRDYFLTVLHAGLRKNSVGREQFRFEVRHEAEMTVLAILRRGKKAFSPWATLHFRMRGAVELRCDFDGKVIRHRAAAPKHVPKAR